MAIIKERHSGQRVMVQKVIRGKNRIFFFTWSRAGTGSNVGWHCRWSSVTVHVFGDNQRNWQRRLENEKREIICSVNLWTVEHDRIYWDNMRRRRLCRRQGRRHNISQVKMRELFQEKPSDAVWRGIIITILHERFARLIGKSAKKKNARLFNL